MEYLAFFKLYSLKNNIIMYMCIILYEYTTLRWRYQNLKLWYIQVNPWQSHAWGGITTRYLIRCYYC